MWKSELVGGVLGLISRNIYLRELETDKCEK